MFVLLNIILAVNAAPRPEVSPASANETVLVLGQYLLEWKEPLVINSNSEISFNFDSTSAVWEACSVEYRGEYYLFGGRFHPRQISKVENCGLRRIGTLDFDFNTGACGSFNFKKEIALLCFPGIEKHSCRRYFYIVDPKVKGQVQLKL